VTRHINGHSSTAMCGWFSSETEKTRENAGKRFFVRKVHV